MRERPRISLTRPSRCTPEIVDVGGILLIGRHVVGAENLAFHHLGEAENGIERRSIDAGQFVPNSRKKLKATLKEG
jgi:hypothetical protein